MTRWTRRTTPTASVILERERSARAYDAALSVDPNFALLIAAWWNETLDRVVAALGRQITGASASQDSTLLAGDDEEGASASLPASLPTLGSPALDHELLATMGGSNDEPWSVESFVTRHLLVRSLASVVASRTPNRILIDAALRLAWRHRLSSDNLLVDLTDCLKASSARAAWVAELAALPVEAAEYEDEWARFEQSRPPPPNDWRALRDPFALWTIPRDSFSTDISFRLELLLSVDVRAWCAAIDSLPSGVLKRTAVGTTNFLLEAPLLERVIDAAPNAFVGSEWTGSATSVLLAMALVEGAGERERELDTRWRSSSDGYDEAKAAHAAYRQHGARTGLGVAFARIAKRPDGPIIIEALVIALIERAHEDEAAQRGWSPAAVAVDAIAPIAGQLEREEDLGLIARASGRTPNIINTNGKDIEALLSAAVVFSHAFMPEGGDSLAEAPLLDRQVASNLWERVHSVLRSPNAESLRASEHAVTSSNWMSRIFGHTLAHAPEPMREWWSGYVGLEPLRRRYTWGHDDLDEKLACVTVFVIQIGLAALVESCAEPTASKPDRLAYFHMLWNEALLLQLTSRDRADKSEILIGRLLGSVDTIFGADAAPILAALIPYVCVDPPLAVACGWFLWRGGQSPRDVTLLFSNQGVDFRELVNEVVVPQERARYRSRPRYADLRDALAE